MSRSNSSRGGHSRNNHLDHLESEVSEVTSLLRDNVEKVVERGDRIDNLQSRSEDLESSSSHFKRRAVQIQRKMWWKNCKLTCLIIVIIFVIILVVTLILLFEFKPWESSGGSHHHNGTLTN